MIVLDTHVWIWWVQGARELRTELAQAINQNEDSGLIVSAISLLEVSRAATLGGLVLPMDTRDWLDIATNYPGIRIAPLDSPIVVDAYRLPGEFHKDPADRLIVATARVMNCPIATQDEKILAYPHVVHVSG